MHSSKRLEPVANLAKQNEKIAAREHGDMLNAFQQQQHQLDELIAYRKQYFEKFQRAGETGLSIVQLRDYHLFLAKLDQAINQQRQQVMQDQSACQQSQEKWIDRRSRSKMIDKVVEHRADQEALAEQHREQREIDDRPQSLSPRR